jgi:hypothetical protein
MNKRWKLICKVKTKVMSRKGFVYWYINSDKTKIKVIIRKVFDLPLSIYFDCPIQVDQMRIDQNPFVTHDWQILEVKSKMFKSCNACKYNVQWNKGMDITAYEFYGVAHLCLRGSAERTRRQEFIISNLKSFANTLI